MSGLKRRTGNGILLPWERRSAYLRELASGRRWRGLLLSLLLAGAVIGLWNLAEHRAQVRTTRASIAEVQRAVAAFRAEVGRCPRSTVELVHPPKAGAQYLDELPNDGWGKPLYVRCPSRRQPTSADVISAGPSGSLSEDDNIL